jgi:hypothetical protein
MISRIRFAVWRRFYVWLKGVLDARHGEPDHSHPPMSDPEQQMVQMAKGCIARVYEIGEKRYSTLRANCESFASKVLESEAYLKDADEEYNDSKDKLRRYMNGDGGLGVVIPRSQLNWRTYMALMTVLGVGEGAFNFIVFQIFRENLPFTFLMSLAVMTGLPALGHFAGMSTRHRKFLIGWSLILVGLAALSGITYLRISFLQSEASLSSDSPPISTPAMAFAYFFLSVLIFVVAIAVAYFYHEPDERLDGLKKDKEKKERKWTRLRHRYSSRKSCLLAMSGPLGSTRASAVRTADGLQNAGIELIAIYRRANRNWRARGDQPPAYFQSYDNAKLAFGAVPDWTMQQADQEPEPERILRQARDRERQLQGLLHVQQPQPT